MKAIQRAGDNDETDDISEMRRKLMNIICQKKQKKSAKLVKN